MGISPKMKERLLMTKAQYLAWLENRGETGTWKYADCIAADQLIKQEALKAFEKYLENIPTPLAVLLRTVVNSHFGSVEVDHTLMELNCYPSWMERK